MKILRLWRLARYLQRKADEGCEVIAVPRWLAPEMHTLIWERRVARAAEKWKATTAEVPLADWKATTMRISKARAEQHWSDAYGRAGGHDGR